MKKTQAGFTLVELLLYAVIIGTLILAASSLLSLLMQSRIKNQSVSEVETQGTRVMSLITQTIRNGNVLNTPALGTTSTSLSVDTTTFDLLGNTIRITEGTTTTPLTNSHVSVSNLTFQNVSRPGTPGIVRTQFTLRQNNPSGRQEYEYSKTFYDSTSLR